MSMKFMSYKYLSFRITGLVPIMKLLIPSAALNLICSRRSWDSICDVTVAAFGAGSPEFSVQPDRSELKTHLRTVTFESICST